MTSVKVNHEGITDIEIIVYISKQWQNLGLPIKDKLCGPLGQSLNMLSSAYPGLAFQTVTLEL